MNSLSTGMMIESILQLAAELITGIGLWKIFEKCNVKGWWAFVPGGRMYWLGRCTDDETSGRMLTILEPAILILNVVSWAMASDNIDSMSEKVLSIIALALFLAHLIYSYRLYVGLCKLFRQKRRYAVLWFLFSWVMAPLWGFGRKYQPRRVVNSRGGSDPVLTDEEKAALAGSVYDDGDGLAVKIKDRTVRDFLEVRYLLREIYMNVKPGHMVLLLGGSGAGKTTLINAIIGYEKADAKILLNGMNVYEDYDLMKYDIGFVPQLDLMRGNDTVRDTLDDAACLRLPVSIRRRERLDKVDATLKQFGLWSLRNNMVEKLSGGQRKRLSIAMEYITDPYLFVLDEPDSGLDGVVAKDLMERLRQIADEGKIVIVITHTPDRVIDVFDDVIVLAKDSKRTGRLAFFGSVEETRKFFGKDKMEDILQLINQTDEGGEGLAEDFITKYAERQVS